jgi:hypothetical protein
MKFSFFGTGFRANLQGESIMKISVYFLRLMKTVCFRAQHCWWSICCECHSWIRILTCWFVLNLNWWWLRWHVATQSLLHDCQAGLFRTCYTSWCSMCDDFLMVGLCWLKCYWTVVRVGEWARGRDWIFIVTYFIRILILIDNLNCKIHPDTELFFRITCPFISYLLACVLSSRNRSDSFGCPQLSVVCRDFQPFCPPEGLLASSPLCSDIYMSMLFHISSGGRVTQMYSLHGSLVCLVCFTSSTNLASYCHRTMRWRKKTGTVVYYT